MSVAATWAPSCSGLCNWWQLVLVWIVAAGTVGVAASQALSPQLAGGGSWWRWWAAGPRCWAVGRGSDGQHPVGARVWLGQAVQDGGRWEPRVRRKKAGGVGHAGAPRYSTRNWAAMRFVPWALESDMHLLALLLSLLLVGMPQKHVGLSFPVCTRGWMTALFTPSGSCEAS